MYVYQSMTTPVISVHAETTIAEIARVMTTHRIRSVSVVNEADRGLGLVREQELFVKLKGAPFSQERPAALFDAWVNLASIQEACVRARHRTAREVVTRACSGVHAFDDIEEAVRMMVEHALESILVVANGELVGVLSRSDVIRLCATTG
jgi:CBS domain-containing protein